MNADTKPKDTDTIDRLFLELSQFTKATTGKELALQEGIAAAVDASQQLAWQIEKCGASTELTKASVMASDLHQHLNRLLPE
jgi:hypothetical protein